VGNVERDRQKGLGLGLSIVRRLCALLDVELSLQSQPGAGTTVTLSLPLAQTVQAVAPPLAAVAGSLRGLRVLVVDDEALVRQSMRMLLTELGCSAHLADGVDAAVRLATAHDFDVVLSDLRLRGGESGLDALRAVQALQPDVHAVLITGDTAPDRIREARAAGLRLLYKPVTLNDLIAALPGR
jgi:CheY-like chemotaxis protein